MVKRIGTDILLTAVIVLLGVAGCLLGSVDIRPMGESERYILMNIRLPRVLMAMLAGGSLSVCGCVFQSLFRNPLSDPYTLGVSSGASLGATIAIVLGLESFVIGLPLAAFITGMATVLIIMKLAGTGNRMHNTTLLLAGVSINFLLSAVICIIMFMDRDDMQKIYFWTMGSLGVSSYTDIAVTAVAALIGIFIFIFHSKELNTITLGELSAQSVGVDVEKVKKTLLVTATLLTSVIVSYCGVIGFVGLVVPHMVRLVTGGDNRKVIRYCIPAGMIFMLAADILSRVIAAPAELPVGSITALIGAPFFIYLLYNAKKKLHF